jgi:hypothetical protein
MTQSIEKAQEEIEKEIEREKQIQIQIQKEKEIEIEEIEIEEEEEEEEVDFHLLDEEEECSGGEENDESPTEEEIIETIANKINKKIKKKKKATTKKNQKKKTTTQQKQRRKKYKDIVIASDKPTKNCVAIEFETCSSKKRALQHALQIFGIMVEGETERRPVFSTDVDKHCVISIQKIPFRTPIGEVLSTIRRILHAKGFEIELPQTLPDGVFVTTGKIELCFQEYAQAAVVLQLLNENVQPFQPRTTHTQKCTGENDKETVENLPFRPFEVTWNPPPKSRNKHLYV